MYDSIQMVRSCSVDDIRRLCVKYNLFTFGTCREYDKMLETVELTKNWEDFAVIETARDIVFKSDTDSEEVFKECNNYKECVVRVANLIEHECIKTVYKIVLNN